jgi:hypothetical protein
MRVGLLESPTSKAQARREAQLLCVGHPVQRIPAGVSGLGDMTSAILDPGWQTLRV